MRKIIRVDGSTTELVERLPMRELQERVGANGFDTVNLRHMGEPLHVMLVDDTGLIDGKPINSEATKLYWANCRAGTTHPICGDVAIVPDEDFA